MLKLLKKRKEIHLYAPVDGHTIALGDVPDKVFASHMLGEGIAFQLDNNVVCAPCDGEITFIPSTLHAFGIKAHNGAEILVHIGLDTVNLKGKGFQKCVCQGDKVVSGTPIIEIDQMLMKEKNTNLITPMVITNSSSFNIEVKANQQVKAGKTEVIFCLKK